MGCAIVGVCQEGDACNAVLPGLQNGRIHKPAGNAPAPKLLGNHHIFKQCDPPAEKRAYREEQQHHAYHAPIRFGNQEGSHGRVVEKQREASLLTLPVGRKLLFGAEELIEQAYAGLPIGSRCGADGFHARVGEKFASYPAIYVNYWLTRNPPTTQQSTLMDAFWLSLAMIFLAELGDKSQLLALTLATCYKTGVVLWGIFCSTLAVHVFATALGWYMGDLLPFDWISFIAGIAFIAFGFWTLRGDHLDDDESSCKRTIHPFWLVFTTFFMAELGDKTMLSTVTLAATAPFIPVWIGSTLGMVLSDALAIVVGKMLGRKLPVRAISIGASAVFFLFGLYSMYEGGALFPLQVWAAALLLIVLTGWFFLRKPAKGEGDGAGA